MTIHKKMIAGLLGLSLLAGCSKKMLDEDSRGVLTADLLFTSKDGFQNAVNGLYDEVRRYQLSAELLKAYDAADVTLCDGKLCANVDPKGAKSGDEGQYRPVRNRP